MKYIAIFLLLANLAYFSWLNYGASRPAFVAAGEDRPLLNNGMILVSEYQERLMQEENELAPRDLVCLQVSGFSGFDEANAFASQAQALELLATVGGLEESAKPQFRVYLPPASSRGMATINLDSLSERAAEAEMALESYLITRGPLENAVALGVFESLDAAQALQLSVEELGYPVEIQEIYADSENLTVRLRAQGSITAESDAWQQLSEGWSSLRAAENLCETIAQGGQFP